MPIHKTILVTRPNHDETVNYLFFFAGLVIEEAKKKNFSVLDLKRNKADLKNFESYIKSKHPSLIFLNGHGSKNMVCGQDNKPILMDNINNKISNSIIYSLSCETGAVLGRNLVENNRIRSFIGYGRKFIFLRSKGFETKPLKDKLAKMFLEPSNLVVITLIKGHDVRTAFDKSQNFMRRNLYAMLSNNASFEEKLSAPYLFSNINCQVSWGDDKAMI